MLIKLVEEELKKIFRELDIDENEAVVALSKRLDLCEYQCNSLFKLAKITGKKPAELGEIISKKFIEMNTEVIEKIEFCNPGFLNINVKKKAKSKLLSDMLVTGKIVDISNNKSYFLDYGGPNVAKPLHVGHLRSAVLGESLKRLFKYTGANVVSDVHLGDYGLQIGQVILGLLEEKLDDMSNGVLFTIADLERIYPYMSGKCKSDDETLEKAREITMLLQKGDEKYNLLFRTIVDLSIKDIKKNYDRLNVEFDLWYGESDAFKYIPEVMETLEEKNIVIKDSGAKIVKFEDDKYPPFLVEKSDGSFLYSTSDLGTMVQRTREYNPDEILILADARQAGHFNQLFEVCRMGDIVDSNTKLMNVKFGTMNGTDNKPFKTREGGVLRLETLFDMVEEKLDEKASETQSELSREDKQILVNSVVKFADLQNYRETNYIFELDRFTEFSGKTGPYILYTAVRIKKIIDQSGIINFNFSSDIDNNLINDLQFKILNFDSAINACIKDYSMHHLCEYVFEVATLVNSFYQSVHILSLEDIDAKTYYVSNLQLAYKVIEDCMDILAINIPTKM